jgi:hypothetical protein
MVGRDISHFPAHFSLLSLLLELRIDSRGLLSNDLCLINKDDQLENQRSATVIPLSDKPFQWQTPRRLSPESLVPFPALLAR